MATLFLTRLRRKLWRERRRLAFVALCMGTAGYLGNMHFDMTIMGLDRALVMGLIYALVFTPSALLMALLIPGWRFSGEVVSVAFLIFGIAGAYDPAYNLSALLQGKTIWTALLSFVAVSHLYSSTLLDGITIASPRTRRRGWSRLPAQVLWDGVVGTPPHKVRLANAENTVSLDYLEPGQPHRRWVERFDRITLLEEHQFVQAIDAPHFIRFRWQNVTAEEGVGFATGEKQVRITDLGRYRRIDMACAPSRLPLRVWVQTWLDDGMGRMLDRDLNTLERRAAVPAPPPPPQTAQPA
ncbi:MAG: hypothetical protein ACXIVG_03000 [Pararhodobacter sp.]